MGMSLPKGRREKTLGERSRGESVIEIEKEKKMSMVVGARGLSVTESNWTGPRSTGDSITTGYSKVMYFVHLIYVILCIASIIQIESSGTSKANPAVSIGATTIVLPWRRGRTSIAIPLRRRSIWTVVI